MKLKDDVEMAKKLMEDALKAHKDIEGERSSEKDSSW